MFRDIVDSFVHSQIPLSALRLLHRDHRKVKWERRFAAITMAIIQPCPEFLIPYANTMKLGGLSRDGKCLSRGSNLLDWMVPFFVAKAEKSFLVVRILCVYNCLTTKPTWIIEYVSDWKFMLDGLPVKKRCDFLKVWRLNFLLSLAILSFRCWNLFECLMNWKPYDVVESRNMMTLV